MPLSPQRATRVLFFLGFCPRMTYASLLLPYGVAAGDVETPLVDDGSSGEVDLTVPFPFFGERFRSLWVNTNGLISFRREVTTYTTESFPFDGGTSMVAPFWADVDIRRGGSIFYRESIEPLVLAAAQHILDSHAAVLVGGFSVEIVFVATWDKVSHYGARASSSARNTFQCVLATDGSRSFAVFMYHQIMWSVGTESGDTHAQVGFDAGDGKRHTSLPESQHSSVQSLKSKSNVDNPGLFIFQIDGADFGTARTCSNMTAVSVSPLYDSVFGGNLLTVGTADECFDASMDVVCIFTHGDCTMSTAASAVDGTRAECIAPPLGYFGEATLQVSRDGGNTTTLSLAFYFLSGFSPRVHIRVDGTEWSDAKPQVILDRSLCVFEVLWDPTEVGPQDTVADVFLEFLESGEVQNGVVLAQSTENSGNYTFTSDALTPIWEASATAYISFLVSVAQSSAPHSGGRHLLWPAIGVMVRLESLYRASRRILKTHRFVSLARPVKPQLPTPPPCRIVPSPTDFQHISRCPCRAEQARLLAEWTVDLMCDGSWCPFHEGSSICYRQQEASIDKSSNQCCYLESGELNRKPPGAGTADLYHPGEYFFQHQYYDVLPSWWCDEETYYRYRQMPTECDDTPMGRPAAAIGDPHITTLSGFTYTFNGASEFVLLHAPSESLEVQARMEPFRVPGAIAGATVITAIVLKSERSPRLQIGSSSYGNTTLQVRVDGRPQHFDTTLTSQDYGGGVRVTMNSTTFASAIVSVQGLLELSISTFNGSLSLITLASARLQNKTVGLLGSFNEDQTKDLITRMGSAVPHNATASMLHYEFGLSWILGSEDESLFHYSGSKSFQAFHLPAFVPLLTENLMESASPSALAVCGTDEACLFDLNVTGSVERAMVTLGATESFKELSWAVSNASLPTVTDTSTSRVSTVTTTTTPPSNVRCSSGIALVNPLTCAAKAIFLFVVTG